MIKNQKTRIYPTQDQIELIEKSFNVARFAWNVALQESLSMKVYSSYTLRNNFVKLVKPNRSWLAEPSKESYANSILDLGKAWKRFFELKKAGKKVGIPKFKSKKYSKQSYRMESTSDGYLSWVDRELKIPRFTGNRGNMSKLRCAESPRWKNGVVKAVTVSRRGDKYFVSVRFEVKKEDYHNPRPVHSKNGGTVGIDWGLKTFLTLSDGTVFETPKLDKINRQIKKAQRSVSRKVLGSKNREKAKAKLNSKTTRKVNIIENTVHQATNFIVRNYNTIKIEDLRPSNMMKNHNLARRISEGSFYKFKITLIYKAEELREMFEEDVTVELVDPRNTSQICSSCGHKQETKLNLSIRTLHCEECGVSIDRDLNAAINISRR